MFCKNKPPLPEFNRWFSCKWSAACYYFSANTFGSILEGEVIQIDPENGDLNRREPTACDESLHRPEKAGAAGKFMLPDRG